MSSTDAAEPRFRPGDRVAVRAAYPLGHVRTPFYVRGKSGIVERLCGAFGNPEELAYARSGLPQQPLYRVRFRQSDVWPNYGGQAADTVAVTSDNQNHVDGRMPDEATVHRHPPRPDLDDTLTYYRAMEIALRELLVAKGVFTADEIRKPVEDMDNRGPAQGARLVAKAWVD